MKNSKEEYLVRHEILELLSDEEINEVSLSQDMAPGQGEEYVDLHRLAQGVQCDPVVATAGPVVPRRAVQDTTWARIVRRLQSRRD